jgi:hypothetical protein
LGVGLTVLDLRTTGEWLCHYTTAEAAFGAILPTRRLRMSPYSRMRDPLENKDLNITFGGWQREGQNVDDLFSRVLRGVKHIRDGMRILSMTIDAPEWGVPFGCAWARPRMWEQYASNHRGVCLVFRRDQLERELGAELQKLAPYYAGPVGYTPDGFSGSNARDLDAADFTDPSRVPGDAAEYIERHHQDFFFLKTADWATEFEFRFALLGPGEDEHVFLDFGGALAAAIVGERFPVWQIPGAQASCQEHGAELRQVNWEMGEPFPGMPSDERGVSA